MSFSQRAIAAISYEVEPLDGPVRVVVQSELVANEQLPSAGTDPRAAMPPPAPLRADFHDATDTRAILVHRTAESELGVAVAMQHKLVGPDGTESTIEAFDDVARLTVTSELESGSQLRLVKLLAYGWSELRSMPALRDQVAAALSEAAHTGWEGLLAQQREFLDRFWDSADVELEGDPELQQATRFALFQVLQAGARAEGRAIAAKGLTGSGYDGHTFWDTETFVLPVLTYTQPEAVAHALRWRHTTLDLARERARQLGFAGAAFPWRTIRGEECSGYWPAGTAAFHINADIADAVDRYRSATDDRQFEQEVGLELLVETARLWLALGHRDASGAFRIDGVTGPDEYSAIADNNVYTNLMAQRNLRVAADAAERQRDQSRALGVDHEETAAWRDAAAAMLIPYDESRGVHPQAEGFTEHQRWDFANTRPDQYPLLLNFPYFDLYRKQVVKQADLVLALYLCGESFSDDEKRRDFDYYEPLTVRDSSLSACTQAIVAAEVGHMGLAYAYFREAALMDLDDLEHNVRDGVHIASLAGAWLAAVAGLGGMRHLGSSLSFAPRLPDQLTRLAFRMRFGGCRLLVEVDKAEARYRLLEGSGFPISHHGTPAELSPDRDLALRIPPLVRREPPPQPPGRELSEFD